MLPRTSTRKWTTPEGYRYLAPYANAVLLRFLVRKLTEALPKAEFRMKTQTNDACRSVVANIEEGWKRPDRKAYLEYLGFSQASLEEVKGDIRRLHQDGFLCGKPNSSLADLGINLKEFKGKIEEDKGNTLLEILYPPLSVFSHNPSPASNHNSNSNHNQSPFLNSSPNSSPNSSSIISFIKDNLTFEMFMELTNKTDYLLRRLVDSLEETAAKEDAMSPMDRWKWRQMQAEHQKQEEFDLELKKILERGQKRG